MEGEKGKQPVKEQVAENRFMPGGLASEKLAEEAGQSLLEPSTAFLKHGFSQADH